MSLLAAVARVLLRIAGLAIFIVAAPFIFATLLFVRTVDRQ